MADDGGGIYREKEMRLSDFLLNLKNKGGNQGKASTYVVVTALIPMLRRLRQEDHKFQANMDLHSKTLSPMHACMCVFMKQAQSGLHAIVSFLHKQ